VENADSSPSKKLSNGLGARGYLVLNRTSGKRTELRGETNGEDKKGEERRAVKWVY